jgi:diguanylate cyclase (GGDEF)-like protein
MIPDKPMPRDLKRRALRSRMLGATLASYTVDAALLGGFALAGTVPGWVPIAYAGITWMVTGSFHALCSLASVTTSRDPYLTVPNLIAAALIQLLAIVLMPQLAFLFLTLLFIVFGIASLRLSTRGALLSWLGILAAMGLTLHIVADTAWLPTRTGMERTLVWLSFAVTLGRCIVLGAFGKSLRDALSRRHQQLAQALEALHQRDAELAANRLSLEHANAELHRQATHDALTGLPNRSLFTDRLCQMMAHAARDQKTFAVLVLDLDRFKLINDSLGHGVGDQLLCHVARKLKGALRSTDTVARAGGDEFMLILDDAADRASVALVAEKLIAAVSEACSIGETELHTSLSIGISLYPVDGEASETLLARADEAMYGAKKLGRSTYQFFELGMAAFSHHHLQLENDLRRALAQGQFELHYQPKIDIVSGTMKSVEALLRWRHPERGLVAPGEFIPLAEETGLILSIGRWVLREACRQAREWELTGLPFLRVAVNLSPVQFRQPGFLAVIRAALLDHDLEPRFLEIEVTESTVMSHAEGSIETLEELSRMGVIVAIDDFGTGYSSMSYLRRFPIDKLKIDRSFIADLASSADDASIVGAIISLAHSLRLKVVAEGVETTAQLELLRALGCDQYQGFIMSAAVPACDIAALAKAHSPSTNSDSSEFLRTHSKLAVFRSVGR